MADCLSVEDKQGIHVFQHLLDHVGSGGAGLRLTVCQKKRFAGNAGEALREPEPGGKGSDALAEFGGITRVSLASRAPGCLTGGHAPAKTTSSPTTHPQDGGSSSGCDVACSS